MCCLVPSILGGVSRNIMNKYGLRVSPCMVPQLISSGGGVPKWFLEKDVVEFLYIFLMILTASKGKPRSSIRASNLVWSTEPKAFWKSMSCEVYFLVGQTCVFGGVNPKPPPLVAS